MIDGPAIVLIRSAYPDAVEILGLPEWASSAERYDVEAKGNPEATGEQLQVMLRTMLAERFKLAAHYETREQQTYALMLARSDGRLGPQLRRYDGDCTTYLDPVKAGREKPEVPIPSNGAPACGYRFDGRRIIAGGVSMNALTGPLRGLAGRIVVDKTGLRGNYEFTLEMGADVTVFTALREQLDLKLESEVNQLPVLVIDRIERPTEN
jgi:uncharacterized protein (TIGR03435 family)